MYLGVGREDPARDTPVFPQNKGGWGAQLYTLWLGGPRGLSHSQKAAPATSLPGLPCWDILQTLINRGDKGSREAVGPGFQNALAHELQQQGL